MGEKAWKDPIVEEIRKIREELGKEYNKDPKGFIEMARQDAIRAGFKLVPPPMKKKNGGSRRK